MMNFKIVFLILSIMITLRGYGMSYEEVEDIFSMPSCSEKTEIRHGISYAVPVDLLGDGNKLAQLPSCAKGKQVDEASESCLKSKTNSVNLIGFKAVTDDYGQLKSILDANNGNEIDSLVVVGPMNKDDFKAIWDCAVYGNMQVLNLENATMYNNAIPDYALYDPIQFEIGFWLKIRRIILPEGVVSIGKAAFPFMGVEEINIPTTVREIGSTVFGFDRWLNCELVIPEGVEEIKYQTFHECNSLHITPKLPKTLKIIGEHAFSMTRFDGLEFPDGLEKIDNGAFQDSGLSHVYLPNTCTTLGDMVFQLSKQIKEIVIPENLECITVGLFSMCDGLERVTINENCRRIEVSAFMCCINLREINFNQKLEEIGANAFWGCSMTTLNLPASLRQLGASSFGVMSFNEVRCASKIPPVCIESTATSAEFAFSPEYGGGEFTLYVPYGSKNAYSTTWWANCFPEIVETDEFPSASVYEVNTDTMNEGNFYDLTGKVISEPIPGQIYIHKGKKIIYQP